MMRNCYLKVLGSLLCGTLFFLPAVALAQIHMELMELGRDAIPPDGSHWHELYPTFCADHVQTAYDDGDGDGQISVCDNFNLQAPGGNTVGYHIDWVGPTYYLVNVQGGDDGWLEPVEPQSGGDPTCEIWMEVAPGYGNEWHIDGWEDNGDQVLSVCDNVLIANDWYHIENIGLNVIVTPRDPVSSEKSTWGEVKSQY
jgi:hypothetical protein